MHSHGVMHSEGAIHSQGVIIDVSGAIIGNPVTSYNEAITQAFSDAIVGKCRLKFPYIEIGSHPAVSSYIYIIKFIIKINTVIKVAHK